MSGAGRAIAMNRGVVCGEGRRRRSWIVVTRSLIIFQPHGRLRNADTKRLQRRDVALVGDAA
jgi:hypothetical protein